MYKHAGLFGSLSKSLLSTACLGVLLFGSFSNTNAYYTKVNMGSFDAYFIRGAGQTTTMPSNWGSTSRPAVVVIDANDVDFHMNGKIITGVTNVGILVQNKTGINIWGGSTSNPSGTGIIIGHNTGVYVEGGYSVYVHDIEITNCNYGIYTHSSNYAHFNDVDIFDCNYNGATFYNSSNTECRYCDIENCGFFGVGIDGGISTRIYDCTSDGNGVDGLFATNFGGGYLLALEGSDFVGNDRHGVNLYGVCSYGVDMLSCEMDDNQSVGLRQWGHRGQWFTYCSGAGNNGGNLIDPSYNYNNYYGCSW